MITCPECRQTSPEGSNFCPNCGAALRSGIGDTTRVIPAVPALDGDRTDPHLPRLGDLPREQAVLAVVRGPNEGATFVLDQAVTTAGRHPQSEIFLDDVTVSRHHARITERGGHHWLSDENSLNGTYVNRALIDGEVALRDNDEVQIGKFRLVYLDPTGRS